QLLEVNDRTPVCATLKQNNVLNRWRSFDHSLELLVRIVAFEKQKPSPRIMKNVFNGFECKRCIYRHVDNAHELATRVRDCPFRGVRCEDRNPISFAQPK